MKKEVNALACISNSSGIGFSMWQPKRVSKVNENCVDNAFMNFFVNYRFFHTGFGCHMLNPIPEELEMQGRCVKQILKSPFS